MKNLRRKISIMLSVAMFAASMGGVGYADDGVQISVDESEFINQETDDQKVDLSSDSQEEGKQEPEETPGTENNELAEENDKDSEQGENSNESDQESSSEDSDNTNEDESIDLIPEVETNDKNDNTFKLFSAPAGDAYATETEYALVFQDEDYEGDFVDSFEIGEWNNATYAGDMAVIYKAVDPVNPNNHVMTFDSVNNTNQRYANNTCIPFYQGEMNPKHLNKYSQYTPEALGYTDGTIVFEIDAFFKPEMKDYMNGAYFMTSASRSAYHKLCTLDGASIITNNDLQFVVNSNVLESKRYYADYNKWHKFIIVYDCKTRNAEYYVDGTLVWKAPSSSSWRLSLAVGFKLFIYNKTVPKDLCYFDNVKISRPTAEQKLISSKFSGTEGALYLHFSTPMNETEIGKLILKDESGADVSEYIKEIFMEDSGKTAKLMIDKKRIVKKSDYSITIPGGANGVKDNYCRIFSDNDIENAAQFNIGRSLDLYVTEKNLASIKLDSQPYNGQKLSDVKNIIYTADIMNTTDVSKKVSVMLLVYGGGDELIKSEEIVKNINAEQSEKFDFEINGFDKEVSDIRLFAFEVNDTTGVYRLLHEPDCIIGKSPSVNVSTTRVLPDGFSVLLSNKENNYISVTGNLSPEMMEDNSHIAVFVKKGKKAPLSNMTDNIYSGIAEVNENGSFTATFKLDSHETADYTVYLCTQNDLFSADFEYISIGDIANFVKSVANGEVAYDDYYSKTLPLSSLIGTDFELAVKTQRDMDLFNRRIDEGRSTYIGDSNEKTVSNYNNVLKSFVEEAVYIQELEALTKTNDIYNKLTEGMNITGIQFGFYNSLLYSQSEYVLSAFIGKSFACKEDVYDLFNSKVEEAQKFFPEKENPEKVVFTNLNFENYDITKFKGMHDKYKDIDMAEVKLTPDPVNAGNTVMEISGNSSTSPVDGVVYTTTNLVLSEDYGVANKKYSDYGIDLNENIIVWKCRFYLSNELRDANAAVYLQPSNAAGYSTGAIMWNTYFTRSNTEGIMSYGTGTPAAGFDDKNSLGRINVNCDEWHTMTQLYDSKTQKISMYIDGETVLLNQKSSIKLGNITPVGLQIRTARQEKLKEGLIYVDDVEHYAVKKRPAVEACTYNVITGNVMLEFTTPINDSTLRKLKLVKNEEDAGQIVKSRKLDDSGYYATVTLDKEMMELNSTYEFIIPTTAADIYEQLLTDQEIGIEIKTGRTMTIYHDINSPKSSMVYNKASLAESTALKYTMIIDNVTENRINAVAGIGIYGEDNELLKYQFNRVTVPSGGGNTLFDINGFENAKYVALYLFNADENGNITKLVHEPDVIEIGNEMNVAAVTSAILPDFSVFASDSEKNYISVLSKSDKLSTKAPVTVFMLDGNSDITQVSDKTVSFGSCKTDENGKFIYSFKYNGNSGEYTVYVVTSDGIYKKNFVYNSLTDTAAFIKKVKSGSIGKDDIFAQTRFYADVIGVDCDYTVKNQRDISLINQYVCDNLSSLSGQSDIEYLKQYKALLEYALREITFLHELEGLSYYGLVEAKLKAYKDINQIDFTEYAKLNDNNKSKVTAALLGKTYVNASDVKNTFNSAVASVKKSGGSEGNGGNGGTGGGNKNYTQSYESNQLIMNTYENSENKNPFDDLSGYSWAFSSIINLKNKGIIDGVSANKFNPSDNVTREQFVKMIVLAANMQKENAECGFNDVEQDKWYYSYVSSAVSNGIINGISETEFGAGRNILRRDMACIIYKTLLKCGYEITERKTEFEDFDLIADYAQEAVAALAADKIINGLDDNTFAPDKTATRAEAAVIIDAMMRRINK